MHQAATGQAQVPIGRPASRDTLLPHDLQPISIGQREALIGELSSKQGRERRESIRIAASISKRRQGIDEAQKLQPSRLVVSPGEPAVPLSYDHQGGCN